VTNTVLYWSLFAKAEFIHMSRTVKLCNGDVTVHTHGDTCRTALQHCAVTVHSWRQAPCHCHYCLSRSHINANRLQTTGKTIDPTGRNPSVRPYTLFCSPSPDLPFTSKRGVKKGCCWCCWCYSPLLQIMELLRKI